MYRAYIPSQFAIGLLAIPALAASGVVPAFAADLPLRGALPPVAEPYVGHDWTGARATIEAGFVRSVRQELRTQGANPQEQALIDSGGLGTVAFSTSSFAAGGGLGYDYQLRGSGLVVGAAADLRYTNLQRTQRASVPANGNTFDLTARQTLDTFGTLRGRLGYAFDNILLYGTGGFAFGHADVKARTDMVNASGAAPFDGGEHRGYEIGTVYGGGIEIAGSRTWLPSFVTAENLSLKVEYLRYDLGKRNVPIYGTGPIFGPGGVQPLGNTALSQFLHQGHLVSAGISYRFAGPGD